MSIISNTNISRQFYDKFIANSRNYPTIDSVIDPNNFTKFSYYDDLLVALKKLIDKNPEALKDYFKTVSSPYLEQTFKYPNKTVYVVNNYIDYFETIDTGVPAYPGSSSTKKYKRPKIKSFSEPMVKYELNFGKFGEDDYNIWVFVDGRKIKESDYQIIETINAQTLYIPSKRVGNNTEVTVVVNRVYKNDKVVIQRLSEDQGMKDLIIKHPLINIGEKHYSLSNYNVFVKRLGSTSRFKLLKQNVDYTVSYSTLEPDNNNADKWLQVTLAQSLDLKKDEYILIQNKLSFYKLTHNVTSITPIIPLEIYSGDYEPKTINRPFIIDNIFETDVFVNGYHLTPEIDYIIEWNLDDQTKPPYMKFNLPFPKNAILEIYANSELEPNINIQRQVYTMDKYGFISLIDKDIPVSPHYLEVYVDNERVNTSNLEVVADGILRIKNVNSLTNVDVRTHIPSHNVVEELLQHYRVNKSELLKFVESVGYDEFINMYINNNKIPPLDIEKRTLFAIDLQLNKTLTFRNYSDISYKVIATFNDGTYEDITPRAFVSSINTDILGLTTQTATFTDDTLISKFSEMEINITENSDLDEVYDIQIYTNKLLAYNSTGRDISYKIVASFFNNTFDDVTEDCSVKTYAEDYNYVIEATYMYNNKTVTAIKKIPIRSIIRPDLESLAIIPDKRSVYNNERIKFTAIATFSDGTTKNVTEDTVFSKIDYTKFGIQKVYGYYYKSGESATAVTEVEIKDGYSSELENGIQSLNVITPTNVKFEIYKDPEASMDEEGLPSLVFDQDITNCIIVIDELFYNGFKMDKNRLILNTPTYIDAGIVDEPGRIKLYSWDKVFIHEDKAYTVASNYVYFDYGISKNHIIFYNGVMVDFDLNPENTSQVKFRDIDITNEFDPNEVTVMSFKTANGEVVKVGRDYGKVDYIDGKVMFAQELDNFIIAYNGVNHQHKYRNIKKTDIAYDSSAIEFIDKTSKVVALALYTGMANIGVYTDERLNEINKELEYSSQSVTKEYRDILTINEDKQLIFDLKYTPINNPTVIVNGVYINDINKNGEKQWICDAFNKRLVWLLTKDNFPEEGLDIKSDWSIIVIYDYIDSVQIY